VVVIMLCGGILMRQVARIGRMLFITTKRTSQHTHSLELSTHAQFVIPSFVHRPLLRNILVELQTLLHRPTSFSRPTELQATFEPSTSFSSSSSFSSGFSHNSKDAPMFKSMKVAAAYMKNRVRDMFGPANEVLNDDLQWQGMIWASCCSRGTMPHLQ
jgi:hypothetical protein